MPYLLVLYFGFVVVNSINAQWNKDDLNIVYNFEELEPVFQNDNDTTYLINFWATWCGPCVKEMPYIQEVARYYEGQAFKLILVSLDFEKHIETRLISFLNKHNITGEQYVLLDGKTNKWIDKVDPEWSGAIPITIVYNGRKRGFYEQEFHSFEELNNIVKSINN